ncbi:MAG: FAD-binding protein [Polyangiaceae bacterium]
MVSRRSVVAGLGAAVVSGFDPTSRSWMSVAQGATLDPTPHLDGTLSTDPGTVAGYAVDAGNIVHKTPWAVLRPGSVADISKMIVFCRRHGIKVSARGQGHTTYGQSQVAAGLVVDMGSLSQIHSISAAGADVDAGLTWRQLVTASVPLGLKPPVLTGYINLSIGGTLSVGGVSSTNTQGCQVDRVKELEVVTGEGLVKRCSLTQNRDLFEAVLAGLGQCGIITRAIIEMVPAKASARTYFLTYNSNADFFADFRELLRRGEFDDLYNIWVPDANGALVYQLNAVKFFDPASPPNDAHLTRNLRINASTVTTQDDSFLNYALRVDAVIDFLTQIGLWTGVLHPWFDVWLPDAAVEKYVGEVIPSLTPEDVGPTGFALLFATKASKLTRPFLRVPACSEYVFLFDILTAAPAPGPNPAFQTKMLARNRKLFDKARLVGGTRYPIGSIEFSRVDWLLQYGLSYLAFKALKLRYDPSGILTPGPGIF